jgi:hypothetical protein
MKVVLHNVMKGIFYSVQQQPIGQDVEFRVDVATDEVILPVADLIGSMSQWVGFGDDVFLCRYVFFPLQPQGLACLMKFYNRRVFLGLASPAESGSTTSGPSASPAARYVI